MPFITILKQQQNAYDLIPFSPPILNNPGTDIKITHYSKVHGMFHSFFMSSMLLSFNNV